MVSKNLRQRRIRPLLMRCRGSGRDARVLRTVQLSPFIGEIVVQQGKETGLENIIKLSQFTSSYIWKKTMGKPDALSTIARN